jgi:hypothetical protein
VTGFLPPKSKLGSTVMVDSSASIKARLANSRLASGMKGLSGRFSAEGPWRAFSLGRVRTSRLCFLVAGLASLLPTVVSSAVVKGAAHKQNAQKNQLKSVDSIQRQPKNDSSASWGTDTVAANPAFNEYRPGTGALGRKILQIPDDWGIRLGGLSVADTNILFTGGNKPGSVASGNLFLFGLDVDAEKKLAGRAVRLA